MRYLDSSPTVVNGIMVYVYIIMNVHKKSTDVLKILRKSLVLKIWWYFVGVHFFLEIIIN